MLDLTSAIARLRAFRSSWDAEDQIDEATGLTAQDLDLVLAALEPGADLEPGGSLTADDLGNLA